MSFKEKYPVKEQQATDRQTQLAWYAREMGYSRDKPKDFRTGKSQGYQAKLERLKREPSDPTSMFGFMSTYWRRFRDADDNRISLENHSHMVKKSLQAGSKVVSGLCDKVAFSLWLEAAAQGQGDSLDERGVLDASLELVDARAAELEAFYDSDTLRALNRAEDFATNPMGEALLALHKLHAEHPGNVKELRAAAIEGAAVGVLMFQQYADDLAAEGLDVTMPRPGITSGDIEEWAD